MAWRCRIDGVDNPNNEAVLVIRASYFDDTNPTVTLFRAVVRAGPDDTQPMIRARLVEIGKDGRRVVLALATVEALVGTDFAI